MKLSYYRYCTSENEKNKRRALRSCFIENIPPLVYNRKEGLMEIAIKVLVYTFGLH